MAPQESALRTSTSSVPLTSASGSAVVDTRVSTESLGGNVFPDTQGGKSPPARLLGLSCQVPCRLHRAKSRVGFVAPGRAVTRLRRLAARGVEATAAASG